MDIKKIILDDLSEMKKNLLLLLNANSGEPLKGKLWYQKGLYLTAKHNEKLQEEADFESYIWGPYSELADSEMEELINLKIVTMENSRYVLTEFGRDLTKTILKQTPKDESQLIEEIKTFVGILNREELLLFIYVSYPDTVEDAIEFKNLLSKRKEISIRMYQNNKISIGKSAELAGLTVNEMVNELQRRRIYKVEGK